MHEKLLSRLKRTCKKIINYGKNEMMPLTKEEKDYHNMQKVYHICKKEFSTDYNNKKHHKVKLPLSLYWEI